MTPVDINKMSKLELLELARTRGVRVTGTMSKSEIIDAIGAEEKRKKLIAATVKNAVGRKSEPDKPRRGRPSRREAPSQGVEAAKKAARALISGKKISKTTVAAAAKEKPMAKPAPPAPPKTVQPSTPRPALQQAPKVAPPAAPKAAPPAAPRAIPPAAPKAVPQSAPKTVPQPPPKTVAPPAPREVPKPAPKESSKPAAKETPKETPPASSKPPAKETKQRGPAIRARRKAAPAEAGTSRPKAPAEEFIRQMAEEGKYYLGAEQRIMPPVEAIDIPSGYGVDRIVALVRDPYWLLTYWEVTDHKYRELERAFGDTWPRCRMILRVYDLTDRKPTHFDITLTPDARNWYVNVGAERKYQIAVGALSPDGRFEQVAISNVVETPSGRVSDRVDEDWMIPDDLFDKIFAASGGLDMHAASAELKGLLERHLLEQITSGSGAISSFGSGAWPGRERKFRLWIGTELILYGGTEPDAYVTVQGKEVKLRPDGTFSLRFALPDGKLDLPVTAESADGVEERTIETGVTKKSRAKEPVIK